jgi:type IX secretion system PorP/SprF family membrane protein
VKGQDPQFSQFYASPLYLGPSMAGSGEYSRLILNYRDQWPKLSGRFVTYALSFDHFIHKYKSGIGLLFLHDNAGNGKLTTTQLGLNYSYRLIINRDFMIQPGLQFQYFQRNLNFNKLTFADQYFGDILLPSSIETAPENRTGHIDFATSILAFGKRYWIGFNVDHLMKMNKTLQNDDRFVPLKFSAFGGYKFVLKERLLKSLEQSITAACHYRYQDMMQQLDLGIYYSQFPFMAGLWYRGIPVIKNIKTSDAISLSGGANIKNFTFTYSYDLTISSLVNTTGGAHELGMVYNFAEWTTNKRRRMATVPCPKF